MVRERCTAAMCVAAGRADMIRITPVGKVITSPDPPSPRAERGAGGERSALAGQALPDKVAQLRLDHSLGHAFAAALHALGDPRHLGGEAALHVLPAVGTGQTLRNC